MNLQTHVDALYETLGPFLGAHDPNTVLAVLGKEMRHILPSWSEQIPDCPGWYWYKPPGINEPQLIHISHGRIDTKLMADLGPPNNLVDVQRVKGQWAGPLLPPG